MILTRAAAFKSLLNELRSVGAVELAVECKKLGPDDTAKRLQDGVNAMCRGLPCAHYVAESLRRYRDSRS
jgi:hypothetical protein